MSSEEIFSAKQRGEVRPGNTDGKTHTVVVLHCNLVINQGWLLIREVSLRVNVANLAFGGISWSVASCHYNLTLLWRTNFALLTPCLSPMMNCLFFPNAKSLQILLGRKPEGEWIATKNHWLLKCNGFLIKPKSLNMQVPHTDIAPFHSESNYCALPAALL